MAKVKTQSATTFKPKSKVGRPNIHAKNKTSKLKSSKLYTKRYRGQGK